MTPTCPVCGQRAHTSPWHCEYDLHGRDDWLKSGCASCRATIPSNGFRVADRFGNLYCSNGCRAEGYATLFERVAGQPGGASA